MKLDQFYTKDSVAKEYFDSVKDTHLFDVLLEPSAGKGAFFKLLPEDKRLGLDLEPKFPGIIEKNFFDFEPDTSKKYLTIGNPPFGKNSSLAIKFFNKASEFSEEIAFIIPRTFKRISVQNKLNLRFKLVSSVDLPNNPCCFEPKMDAKCCFQIWKKTDIPREIIKYKTTTQDFVFAKYGKKDNKGQPTVPSLNEFDIVMKAYGSNCGKLIELSSDLRPKSYHFIKSTIPIQELIRRFETLDYSVSDDTVRQSSLGKGDLIKLYEEKFK